MPHYDYLCLDCGVATEEFQSMTEKPISVCSKCGGRLKRLIGSGAGVIFKGTGFYKTDYSNSNSAGNKPVKCENKKESNAACASCEAGKTK